MPFTLLATSHARPYAPPHSPRTHPIPLPPTETGKVTDPRDQS